MEISEENNSYYPQIPSEMILILLKDKPNPMVKNPQPPTCRLAASSP